MFGGPSSTARAFVAWTLKHGLALWIVALALAVPAATRTASLYAHLHSEIEELLPEDAPSKEALDEMRARSPGLQYLAVVVEVQNPGDLPAAERFLDDLATRIRAYPPGTVRDVRTSNAEEEAFLRGHAALYADADDLRELRRRVEARRDYEVMKETGGLFDDAPPPAVDFDDLRAKYSRRLGTASGGRLSNASLGTSMLLIETSRFTTGADSARSLLVRVQSDVAALRPETYAPMQVGYASDVAMRVEELDALQADLSVSSVLVILAVIAVIAAYFRWYKSVLVLVPPLLLATVYAFAIASLRPMKIKSLNSSTAFLGSIIIGNGINVGLVLLARYREERARGASVEDALVAAVWGARKGTLAAAAAASVAYASLVVTEFRGFRQFGIIGGIGMLTSWLTAFVLIPPLVKWFDKGPPLDAAPRGSVVLGWIVRAVERAPGTIVAVAALLALGAAAEVSRFDSSWLEHDANKLRRSDTWETGEGHWAQRMHALLGRHLTPTVLLCDSPEQARAVEASIRDSVEHGELAPLVARVPAKDDVVPPDQPRKLDEARALREALTPKVRASLSDEQRRWLDETLGDEGLEPVTANDVPRGLTAGLREVDGSVGRTILVYPRASDALWRAEAIHTYVGALRRAGESAAVGGGRPARVAGAIPLSSDLLSSIARDAPIASLASLLGVIAVVIVVVRRTRMAMVVIASLALGVLWLAGATMALGIKVNFVNFIAFPITFGIGVDYSVNVMTRYVQDGERDVTAAIRSTGGAVALCSLTTIIGYSSLLLAKNRALFLFGGVAVMGEVACLTTAIVVLPAALVLLRRMRLRLSSTAPSIRSRWRST